MPKKSSRRKRRPFAGWFTPLALIVVAGVFGSLLLRPNRPAHPVYRAPTVVAQITPAVTPSLASQTPTPMTAVSSSPQASPASPSPSLANPHAPRLALIVDDCGQWLATERGYIALPIPLTLSVLPHVRYSALIGQEAATAGKGVMLHLPMEPLSEIYPGPGEITTAMTDDQIKAQVADDLAQVPLAQGVNNHEGSKASADPRVMGDVIGVLAGRGGLFFIDSRTSAASVGARMAEQGGVPTASRNVFLDNRASVAYTEEQLEKAAEIAERTGSAIAIGHPRPTTLEAVRALYPRLQAEGIDFVLAGSLTR